MNLTGRMIKCSTTSEVFHAFVPVPLALENPIELSGKDTRLLGEANQALGRLDGVASILPDVSLFLYTYIRKEAVLSSQIEGTQSSYCDLLFHEDALVPGVPLDDVQEISNYVAAMEHGLRRLREDKFPLSLRLIREIHAVLLRDGRGESKDPGEFRRSQNWIGGSQPGNATFVPPPPEYIQECMGEFEKFLHSPAIPTLIKAAMAHVQLETIHPFLDGNGRVGRLLIILLLCNERVLSVPLLYLSLYFKENRPDYYRLLQNVRMENGWLEWIHFFLTGVRDTANQAAEAAKRILRLFDQAQIQIETLGRGAGTAQRILLLLQRKPIITIPKAAAQLGVTPPTARGAITGLEKLGLVREITGKHRNRVYMFSDYMAILDEGTAPLPR
ncbi:MAG: Fic family protein [Phycisphaerae bacterium]|nr:Fic family protein [Phycisphaerae bacterium]